jgi:enamine deaminase RidA (YjgF/YER057c/UK114 family)
VIATALESAGFAMADVVRATYYFTDAAYWDEVGSVLGEAFGEIRPAATALVVGLVKPEMKVEIEVTALKRG